MSQSINFRIGHGYDAHHFQEGLQLTLAGIKIPYEMGLGSHSDGDVVIHALCDALLGAAGRRDIGSHFPPSDPNLKDMASKYFLEKVMEWLRDDNWQINNIDISIIAEQPKLAPHINAMQDFLAHHMEVDPELINIKATTNDGMGFIGRKEGIACNVVVLLRR